MWSTAISSVDLEWLAAEASIGSVASVAALASFVSRRGSTELAEVSYLARYASRGTLHVLRSQRRNRRVRCSLTSRNDLTISGNFYSLCAVFGLGYGLLSSRGMAVDIKHAAGSE